MSVLKALLLGAILTFLVSGAIHGANYSGGFLQIDDIELAGQFIQWSWPLFVAAAGGIWGILLLMR